MKIENAVVKRFQFYAPTKIVSGPGALKAVGRELSLAGKSRPLVVVDRGLAKTESAAQLRQVLKNRSAAVFDRVAPESGIELVESAAKLFRDFGADSIVSLGGGSTIDTAKAVQGMILTGAQTIDEFKPGTWKNPLPFHIAIPTTAGTGSEVTSMAMILDPKLKIKRVLLDPAFIPVAAILDPELTLGLPRELTAASGADAFAHAVEAVLSLASGPLPDIIAGQALKLLFENVPKAVKNGSDISARSNNLIAATLAGMAFQNALLGVVHALAHSLGAKFGISHGLAVALCLPAGMEYNLPTSEDRIMQIGSEILPRASSGQEVVAGIRDWLSGIGLSQRLSELGIKREKLKDCAELAMTEPNIYTNPRKPAAGELLELLEKIY